MTFGVRVRRPCGHSPEGRCLLACRPAQFAEETKGADRVVPRGIVWSVVGTAVLGSSYLLTLLFCIQVNCSAHLLQCDLRPTAQYVPLRLCVKTCFLLEAVRGMR